MRGRILPLLVLLVLAAPFPAAAAEDNYDKILEQFEKQMKRGGLDRRARAISLLDPNHPRSLPPLFDLLAGGHWFVRGHAAETLARVTDDPLRAELRLNLLTHEEPLVREGIALAFALSPEKGDAEALSEALSDGAFEVRRSAAIALGGIVSRESIEALISALRKESDARVAVHLAATLRKITGRNLGRDAGAWARFWEANKDAPGLEGLDEEVKNRKLGGIPLETVTVPGRKALEGGEEVTEPLDFFVLPPFGWSHDVYRPYLDELSKYGRVTYVNLPDVTELTGLSGYGNAIPTYPVKSLVKALEELRREMGRRRVVILGEGATGWIAEAYAIAFRKHTAGLIVLNGFIDTRSYATALLRLKRAPKDEERWVAETLLGENDMPHDREVHRVMTRIQLTMDLANPSDSRGWLLWRSARDPQGFATVPDIRLPERAKIEVPALFYWGAQSRLTGFPDAERIRRHFPGVVLAPLLKSKGFCFASEYEEFYRILEGFLSLNDLR